MANTYHCIYLHIVFSTSGRRRLIKGPRKPQLWRMMAGIAKREGLIVIAINGMEEHVHLLLMIPPAIAVAKAVGRIKAVSSRWMKGSVPLFGWQQGYSCFPVSRSIVPAVKQYILDQEQHHRRYSFEQEYMSFLRKHEVSFEAQYVFD